MASSGGDDVQWTGDVIRSFRVGGSRVLRQWDSLRAVVAVVRCSSEHFQRRTKVEEPVPDTYQRAAAELAQLAAGLAHEIRNPLHALRLNLHAFRRTQEDRFALKPEEIARMLDQSAAEIDRIDRLLRELIGFAAPLQPRVEVLDLNSELEDVVEFLRHEFQRTQVELRLELPKWPAQVEMDRSRLRQVLLNLLYNARDAMPEGGVIAVEADRREGWMEITVSDQGGGITEADMPHLFEPFFTTSESGTGLGLAVVRRFVHEAGGQITCENLSGENGSRTGALFRIRLEEVPLSNTNTGASP